MSRKKVHLLDYVAGNIRSLVNAIEKCGWEVEWIRSPEDVEKAEKIILPGVGHFGHCLNSLSTAGFLEPLRAHISAGKPFFGICVGLQALFAGSSEAPSVPGLGLIPETLARFSSSNKSVPCIGWNSASTIYSDTPSSSSQSQSFYGLCPTSKYYYVHSYFAPYTQNPSLSASGWTIATATYGNETYIGALGRDNIFATQFHPEKSGAAGLRVIKAFLEGEKFAQLDPSLAHSQPQTPQKSQNCLTHRIIACLDVRTNDAGDLVVTKGDQYDVREKTTSRGVRNLGKPVDLAKRYYNQGADEITFLNITSFRDCPLTDLPMLEILRKTSEEVFVPLTIGGGIRDMYDPGTDRTVSALEVAKMYFASGADKVSIGSDAVTAAEQWWSRGRQGDGTSSIETISQAYGRQAVVVSVDPKRVYLSTSSEISDAESRGHTVIPTTDHPPNSSSSSPSYHVYFACTTLGGRKTHDFDVVKLVQAVESLGCGEILLNAIDRDGTNRGYDLELISLVKRSISIPVIASSGAGKPGDFVAVFNETSVDAALGAGIFHRGEYTVAQVKEELEGEGLGVRGFEEF